MDSDLFLVIGLVLGVLSLPPIIGAFSQGRPPRVAAIVLMIASGLVALALISRPSGYRVDELPRVFSKVISRYVN